MYTSLLTIPDFNEIIITLEEHMIKNEMQRHYLAHREKYDKAVLSVLESGWYITGNELKRFEESFAHYVGVKHCVGLANGLDALWIGMKLLGIKKGDEVIVQSNAYIATVMGITINHATPIFVEPDETFNLNITKIEEKISDRTKAILVTHLYGQASNMSALKALCEKHKLYLVEDCAQSHGAKFDGTMTGAFGDLACFSFYPTKNLGAFGDGGAITTPHDNLAQRIRIYRNYGSEKRYYNQVVGINSRLDEMQAALLNVKLVMLDQLNDDRRHLAEMYLKGITNPNIKLPKYELKAEHVWHQFVIRCKARDQLIEHLNRHEIQTIIHYPIPPHLSEAYQDLGYKVGDFPIAEDFADTVLSLPLFDGMLEDEVQVVIEALNAFKPS